MIRVRVIVAGLFAAALLVGVGGVVGARSPAPPAGSAPAAPAPVDQLLLSINRAQERLKTVPGDYVTWAALGSAYVERARITGDPGFYPRAEGALRRSIELRPDGNGRAWAGLGALANARHDFAAARDWAGRALSVNPYDADAYGVLADAETQLGNAGAATAAVQRMLDLRPGLPAFARASYDLEQHGRTADAQALMRRALEAATGPSDIAFCRYQLGELAWHAGRLDEADREYAAGSIVDPGSLSLLRGRARVDAARGRLDAALAGYAELTRRAPIAGYFGEYAELLRVAGRGADADVQLALADAAQRLFVANGGSDDLAGAQLALARSQPAEAVRLAGLEWQRRQHADVADLLGWALYETGRPAEALPYARRADALGGHNAEYAFHLAMVELALGDRGAAATDLARAVELNPNFSPVYGPIAARTLAELRSS